MLNDTLKAKKMEEGIWLTSCSDDFSADGVVIRVGSPISTKKNILVMGSRLAGEFTYP